MFELNKSQSGAVSDSDATGTRDKRPAPVTAQSGETAVIGRSITIDGDLRGEENLRIEGNINGTVQLPNHSLTIGKEGQLKADAYANSVIVDGTVNGDLYGSECVSIRASARVEGNIVAARVQLEEGAQFKGSIDMDPESIKAALGTNRGASASGISGKATSALGDSESRKSDPVSISASADDDAAKATSAH